VSVAEEKRLAREAKLARTRGRARFKSLGIAVSVAAVVFALVWLYRSDTFQVTQVDVVGTARLSREAVISLAAIPKDATLLNLSVDRIVARVKSSPWVAEASLARRFPHTVVITVAERKPFAAVAVGRVAYLIDKSAVVLAAQPATTTDLPLIQDAPLPTRPLPSQRLEGREFINAIDVLLALPDSLRSQVQLVHARTIDDLRLITRGGLEIVFGRAEQLDKKRFVVEKLIGANPKKIIYIDVRTPDSPAAKYAP
jgi:cell division protein FtsQ